MPPKLKITPLGDLLAQTEFEQRVLRPYAELGSEDRVESNAESYEENYTIRPVVDPENQNVDDLFKTAFRAEFGFEVADLRQFLDLLEDYGVTTGQAVFEISKDTLIEKLQVSSDSIDFAGLIDEFCIWPRDGYRNLPEGYKSEDVDPWRFRRRISLIRSPIIALDKADNPNLIVAPGMIREFLAHLFAGYHEGIFKFTHYRSDEMKSWIGSRKDQRGNAFAIQVAGLSLIHI